MEAHAMDEWPLGKRRSTTPQHQDIEERCAAARRFRARRMVGRGAAGGGAGGGGGGLEPEPEPEDIAAAATVPVRDP